MDIGALFKSQARVLRHRGPDQMGSFFRENANSSVGESDESPPEKSRLGLLHLRLSIIDLSPAGKQPMAAGDGRYVIIFNGEIYNYIELRSELQKAGHHFCTATDTEVLLKAYIEWGSACLRKLVGMFSFAVFDSKAENLFIARDFFGIKPLYYVARDGFFAFASEIKALLDLPGVTRDLNADRAFQYLRFARVNYGEETLFSSIKQLPAGNFANISTKDAAVVEKVQYWQPNVSEERSVDYHEAARSLRALFLDSVRLHLRSDVPVGAALSGGIDSSAIVMAMRELEPNLEIHAFSYIADDPELSEEKWIDVVADAGRLRSHRVTFNAQELVEDLDDIVYMQDEPFGSSSIYAQYRVFKAARENGIKVMLDGQGADELFAGYPFFQAARFATLVRRGRFGAAADFLRKCSSLPGRKNLWMRSAPYLLPTKLQSPFRWMVNEELIPPWLNWEWFAARNVIARPVESRLGKVDLRSELKRAMTEPPLPGLLRHEDRNSMAHSIESRVPFLTPALADFALSLPEHFLISNEGIGKSVFRDAMRGLVPDSILDRKDKIGFAPPERDMLKAISGWVDETLQFAKSARIPVLNYEGTAREWERVRSGKAKFGAVWKVLNFIRWVQVYQVRF
jgi:asparagine synthase (glutamine-hydrolysing)